MITHTAAVAANALRAGHLVALPTETVYGLGADAANPSALARLYAVKGRPIDHPSIVHLADLAEARTGWSSTWPAAAERLAEAFWPGPLTIVLPAGTRPDPAALGGTGTVALRIPDCDLTREAIRLSGAGIAAPSANRFGRVSPTTVQHVLDDLGSDVDLILDGGPCTVGVESTIVDLTGAAPRILRPGAITAEMLEAALGISLSTSLETAPRAPGTLAAHYAPRLPVVVVESLEEAISLTDRQIALVADASDPRLSPQPPHVLALLDTGDSAESYAERLYSLLRQADTSGADLLVAVLPPIGGVGDAIRDRLTRAATSA
ncbi:MAG: threonylcarbamoyl-AMP synthase [Thermoleophilia bacterium]|nr:threonylcarbamoyl-AMP synthase [Thermoleophilia bacterium]